MNDVPAGTAPASLAFPRFFRIGGYRVSSFKVFLCVGIYAGILLSAVVGERSGISPLALGGGLLLIAIVGLIGARLYHVGVNYETYRRTGFSLTARHPAEGGWSVLGGLVAVPLSFLFDAIFGIPLGVFWDHAAVAIASAGAWIRFGCICNGCCVGRESDRWFALRQHDVHGVYRRRIPVQWMEIAWWLLACGGLIWLWPKQLPTGSYAFAVLAWYGFGRVWLEQLRRPSDVLFGVRVNQIVAALLALLSGAAFLGRMM